jgi:hypothetical protein
VDCRVFSAKRPRTTKSDSPTKAPVVHSCQLLLNQESLACHLRSPPRYCGFARPRTGRVAERAQEGDVRSADSRQHTRHKARANKDELVRWKETHVHVRDFNCCISYLRMRVNRTPPKRRPLTPQPQLPNPARYTTKRKPTLSYASLSLPP